MGQVRLPLLNIAAIFTGIICFVAPAISAAQNSDPSAGYKVYLMSGARTSRATSTRNDLQEFKQRPRQDYKLAKKPIAPNLEDIGLDLKGSNFSKRNELDSFNIQPWAPGRGAVGVKVEVTW